MEILGWLVVAVAVIYVLIGFSGESDSRKQDVTVIDRLAHCNSKTEFFAICEKYQPLVGGENEAARLAGCRLDLDELEWSDVVHFASEDSGLRKTAVEKSGGFSSLAECGF